MCTAAELHEDGLPFVKAEMTNEAYTVTFGDRAENEAGMQMIGTLAPNGVSAARLEQVRDQLQ